MIQYADAYLEISTDDEEIDFSTVREIIVSFSTPYGYSIDISGDAVSVINSKTISVKIAQEQTGKMAINSYTEIQVNIIDKDGERIPSYTSTIDVSKNILKKVI